MLRGGGLGPANKDFHLVTPIFPVSQVAVVVSLGATGTVHPSVQRTRRPTGGGGRPDPQCRRGKSKRPIRQVKQDKRYQTN
jgi:hypothetical protein